MGETQNKPKKRLQWKSIKKNVIPLSKTKAPKTIEQNKKECDLQHQPPLLGTTKIRLTKLKKLSPSQEIVLVGGYYEEDYF